MEQKEKVVCKRCSHYYAGGNWYSDSCEHPSCFEGTWYDPVTGREVTKRFQDYSAKNRNLDCPDFKKKWFLF